MIEHQIRMGGLVAGETAYVKLGGDGTSITRSDKCTVHTVTLSNSEKALQISTIIIVLEDESYEVRAPSCVCVPACVPACVSLSLSL